MINKTCNKRLLTRVGPTETKRTFSTYIQAASTCFQRNLNYMIKQLLSGIAAAMLLLTATPVLAAPPAAKTQKQIKAPAQVHKNEAKKDFIISKKTKRAAALASRATIESAFRDAMRAANQQFTTAVKASKSLKGRARSAAIRAAHSAQRESMKTAKENRKTSLKALTVQK